MSRAGKLCLPVVAIFLQILRTQCECPNAVRIIPCVCEEQDNVPSMLCQDIGNEDDLIRVFNADFPTTEMETFNLELSSLTEITSNVFGNVSFRYILLNTEYLSSISENVFDNSLDTLQFLHIVNCPVTTSSFPFNVLGEFSALDEVLFNNNLLVSFPSLSSDFLKAVRILENDISILPSNSLTDIPNVIEITLRDTSIDTLEDGVFDEAEMLVALYLNNNRIQSISSTLFTNMTNLIILNLRYNQISTISEEAFVNLIALKELNLEGNSLSSINNETFVSNENLEVLNLQSNNIESIEQGSFTGTSSLSLLDLSNNKLSRIVTGMFEGLGETELYLENNSINYIESNSFGDLSSSAVFLNDNNIEALYEFWMRPLLESNNQIFLYGNPFTCGCEIAWLFEDPSFQSMVYGRCPDDKFIAELDPVYFQDNC